MHRCLLLVFLLAATAAFTQPAKTPVKVTDLLKVKSLGSVTISKDGSKAAFTVTSIEPEENAKWEYRYETQIWMVNTDGNSLPRQLTSKENASQPAFSPDGKQLAFVRSVDGKPQVFLLPLDGGEGQQLTHFRYGASSPRWSPNGKQILFAASIPLDDLVRDSLLNDGNALPVWPMEKPGFAHNGFLKQGDSTPDPDGSLEQVRAYLDKNADDKKARVINKLNFQDERDVNPDMAFTHFFITSIVPGSAPQPVTRGFFRFNSAGFTPDGKQLVLAGNTDSLMHPDRALESAIFMVNTDGSYFRKILGAKDKVFSNPLLSPSGRWLAFQQGSTSFVQVPALAIISLAAPGSPVTEIPFDRNKNNLSWSSDDKFIYFTAPSNGGFPLHRADPVTKKIEQLTDYNSGVSSFALAGGKLVFVKTEVANPFELYLAGMNGKNQQRISDFNHTWVSDKLISFPEKKSFTNSIGQEIEYWVMKPAHYQPGKKYPVLLEIHGGPSAMWGPGESSMWHEYQFFCSKGYGVVYANPRGSGGYGQEFLRSNINDWGAGPAHDVLKALDLAVGEGWADTSRLVLTGGSYAGYLVAWIIAHDQRFKAACSQRGVYDLATFFGEGNAWRLIPNYFGGYPWEEPAKSVLERESPIHYVHRIKTPYIIFHGENDRRTGVIQSEMLYRSLKALGRPVEYVRHPSATHEITRSGNNRQRIDQMLRTWEFFERWIHPRTPGH